MCIMNKFNNTTKEEMVIFKNVCEAKGFTTQSFNNDFEGRIKFTYKGIEDIRNVEKGVWSVHHVCVMLSTYTSPSFEFTDSVGYTLHPDPVKAVSDYARSVVRGLLKEAGIEDRVEECEENNV